jgi:hypothetical protein
MSKTKKDEANKIKTRLADLVEQRNNLEITIIKITGAIEILSAMVKQDED